MTNQNTQNWHNTAQRVADFLHRYRCNLTPGTRVIEVTAVASRLTLAIERGADFARLQALFGHLGFSLIALLIELNILPLAQFEPEESEDFETSDLMTSAGELAAKFLQYSRYEQGAPLICTSLGLYITGLFAKVLRLSKRFEIDLQQSVFQTMQILEFRAGATLTIRSNARRMEMLYGAKSFA